MEQTKVLRRTPIKKHLTNCTKCGHKHDVKPIIEQFEAHGKSSMSFYCHSCDTYHRVKQTKAGLISLNGRKSRETSKSATIRKHRMECAYCNHPIDKEDFDFLLKIKDYRRTTCKKCYGALVARRTARGFYVTTKTTINGKSFSIQRLPFDYDYTTKRFKLLKNRYYVRS
jgi:RNase P subunit RPR2